MRHEPVTRREAIKAGGALAALGVLGHAATHAQADALPPKPARSVRLAHLTDSHIQPERGAFDGVAACLRHVASLKDRPDVVVTGGDLIMDAFETDAARARLQWDLYTRVFRDECPAPVHHCLGNHDIWGWNRRKSGTTGAEPGWGKQMAVDVLGIPGRHYAFDLPGRWRCLVLDSVQPDGGEGYIGRIDEEQLAWLEARLADAPDRMHVVVSHIPILSLCALELDASTDERRWTIPGGVMHLDAKQLMALFRARGNVKCCLSGHIHKVERADFDGVTFICGGAVSGAWWKGRQERCDEGYGVVDLNDDGSVGFHYMTYGWKSRPA